MIRAFRWAVAFLTVVPLAPRGEPREGELARAAAAFPLVGAGVGLACWGVDVACAGRVPDLARGLLVVAAAAVLTRGLHLDGLADTADGLGSMRDRAGMLEVMRDPSIGALGATALVIAVLVQAACVAGIPEPARMGGIVAAAVASRLTMTLGARAFRYARESGKASAIIGRVPLLAALVACVLAAACAFAAGAARGTGLLSAGGRGEAELVTLGVGAGAGLAAAIYTRVRLGGATGDTLGASGEIAQTAALVWAATRAGG